MNLPNLLTLSRIALIPLIIVLLYSEQAFLAAGIFLLAAMLDALDGFLARRLNAVTNFGKLMDPLADKLLIICVLLALVDLKTVALLPVALIIAREVLITAWRLSKISGGSVIPAGFSGKLKAVLEDAAVLLLILKLPLAGGALWIAVIAAYYSGVEYIWKSRSR